jgi:hypothetical protein
MHHFCNHTTHTNPHPQYHTPTGKHTHTMRGLSFAHILATQAVNSSCRSDRYNNYHPKFLRHLIAATECTKRHTCACASTSSCTYAHDKQTHIHNHTHTYTHKDTYTPTHTHRHTQTHTGTHDTHTHTFCCATCPWGGSHIQLIVQHLLCTWLWGEVLGRPAPPRTDPPCAAACLSASLQFKNNQNHTHLSTFNGVECNQHLL